MPSVAAVNVVGTTLTLKYLHCYNTVSIFWMFLTKISKLPKLTKFPYFQWIIEEKLFGFYLQCYNNVNDLHNVAGVVLTSKILTLL